MGHINFKICVELKCQFVKGHFDLPIDWSVGNHTTSSMINIGAPCPSERLMNQ